MRGLRLGIVDCHTSHVVQFVRRLHHFEIPEGEWVTGATVTAAFVGSSTVTPPERVAEYVAVLERAGVRLVDDPIEVLQRADAVLVESQEGAVHAARALPFLQQGVPVFVDKPFALSTADATRMVEAALRSRTVVFSASALRYAAARVGTAAGQTPDIVLGCDVYSPAPQHPANPGLFHYGVHGVEVLYQVMGPGCQWVSSLACPGWEHAVGGWREQRVGTLRASHGGAHGYGYTAFLAGAAVQVALDASDIYRALLEVIVSALSGPTWMISPEELVEVVSFQEAYLQAGQQRGGRVPLAGTRAAV